MRHGFNLLAIVVGSIAAASAASAADLTGAEIKAMIAGKSVYLETTGASVTGAAGQGTIFYAEDGSGFYKTPSGAVWRGSWQIKDNTLISEWKERQPPGPACSRLDKTGDTIQYLDCSSGQVRAKFVKAAPGNAENLK